MSKPKPLAKTDQPFNFDLDEALAMPSFLGTSSCLSVPPGALVVSEPGSELQVESSAWVVAKMANSICAVCMEGFRPGNGGKGLPCGHVYHSHCILPWLSFSNTCPVCRAILSSSPRVSY